MSPRATAFISSRRWWKDLIIGGIESLSSVLRAMPDTADLDLAADNPIDDDVWPHDGEFACAGVRSRSAAVREMLKPVGGSQ